MLIGESGTAFASREDPYPPHWSIAKAAWDPSGSGAVLTPGNDSRANLLLLLADRRQFPLTSPGARKSALPLVLMSWDVMRAQALGVDPNELLPYPTNEGSRCQTLSDGAAAFEQALKASAASATDKAALSASRRALKPNCDWNGAAAAMIDEMSGGGKPPASNPATEMGFFDKLFEAVSAAIGDALRAARCALTANCDRNAAGEPGIGATSPVGREYASYLAAAGDFYGGRFDQAARQFEALSSSSDRWLRETSAYMIARTRLNQAVAANLDQWGSLAEPAKRDISAALRAAAGLTDYLNRYPAGQYAASARALMRRAHWLSNDRAELAQDFEAIISNPASLRGVEDVVALVDEADDKLIGGLPGGPVDQPLLQAVVDLQRMRTAGGEGDKLQHPLGRPELDRQAPLFRDDKALFQFLQASHAMWIAHNPREVLALIPDASDQLRFSYLEFSRQMLRGLALDALGDANARGFFLSLFPGAIQPYQRGAVELALAAHDERRGHPEAVFAPGSPVTHPVIRDLLLEFTAGPDLLRRQARLGQSEHEKRVALYILLSKKLQRGFYKDFVTDVGRPMTKSEEFDFEFGAQKYNTNFEDEMPDPPLSVFASKNSGRDERMGCPSIRTTARQLAADPHAVRPVLCHAEFLRTHGFDNFEFDARAEKFGLGSGPSQFPGRPYVRMAAYAAVLSNPRATADDKALALNRMIRCYQPSGYSSCGGKEVETSVRRAWFNRLKREYAASHWAKELPYYW